MKIDGQNIASIFVQLAVEFREYLPDSTLFREHSTFIIWTGNMQSEKLGPKSRRTEPPIAMAVPFRGFSAAPPPQAPNFRMQFRGAFNRPRAPSNTFFRGPNDHSQEPAITNIDPTALLFVGNIDERCPDSLIQQMLELCGTVEDWKRIQGPDGRYPPFGFCGFAEAAAAVLAIRVLNEFSLGNKRLNVKADEKVKQVLVEYCIKDRIAKRLPSKPPGHELEPDEGDKARIEDLRKQLRELISKEDPTLLSQNNGKDQNGELKTLKSRISRDRSSSRIDDVSNMFRLNWDIWVGGFLHSLVITFEIITRMIVNCETVDFENDHELRVVVHDLHEVRPRTHANDDPSLRTVHQVHELIPTMMVDIHDPKDETVTQKTVFCWRRRRSEKKEQKRKDEEYLKQLKKFEEREKRMAKQYAREDEADQNRKKTLQREAKKLMQFLEDYNDEQDDPKYYKSSAFIQRKKRL
ncbi:hypothetical protein M3Y98_00176400 [Aphelenchoides besseyi]|nr:hypothetical protein M3Y98_00176400 [Aphelenchoides besseyi]